MTIKQYSQILNDASSKNGNSLYIADIYVIAGPCVCVDEILTYSLICRFFHKSYKCKGFFFRLKPLPVYLHCGLSCASQADPSIEILTHNEHMRGIWVMYVCPCAFLVCLFVKKLWDRKYNSICLFCYAHNVYAFLSMLDKKMFHHICHTYIFQQNVYLRGSSNCRRFYKIYGKFCIHITQICHEQIFHGVCMHRVDREDITIIILDTKLVSDFDLHACCFFIAGNRPVLMLLRRANKSIS